MSRIKLLREIEGEALNKGDSMMRRTVLCLIGAALIGVGPHAVAIPEVPLETGCPQNEICVWDTPGWQGKMTVVHGHMCFNQRVMSARNGGGAGPAGARVLLLWTEPDCQGERDKVLVPNQSEPVVNEMSFEVDGL